MTRAKFIFCFPNELFKATYNTVRAIHSFHIFKLASTLCAQLASLYLVYLLTPGEYGQFGLIASVAQFMFILTSGWSSGAIINLGTQSFARNGNYKAVVFYRICIVAASFAVVVSVFILLRPSIEEYLKISGFFAHILLLFLGYVCFDHASQLLYPGNRDKIQAGLEFVATFAFLLIVTVAVKDLQGYIYAYITVFAAFSVVVSIVFITFFRDQAFLWNKDDFKSVLFYSTWQIIGIICIYIINLGMNYVLAICNVSVDKIGIYNLTFRLYSGFAPFFALFGILIPKWIYSPNDAADSIDKKILKIILWLSVLYLFLGISLAPLFRAFGMQRYLESVTYYFMLFPAFLFTSYSNLLNTVIANTASFRRAQVGIFLQSGVLVISSFPLVSLFGVSGAILAITVASTAGVVYFYKIRRTALIQKTI